MPDPRLDEYVDKREFPATPEPSSTSGDGDDGGDGLPRFVIHKHDSSSLHYDIRLEVDGVLKSWAVPKGPSTDPADRRLAIPTEDHPREYLEFEGVIPEDQYGAGPVMVWDTGTYENRTADDDGVVPMQRATDDGHIVVWLEGEKLSGGYALTRTGSGDDSRWILVKMDDADADARRNPTSTEPDSAATGRTMDEIVEDEGS